MSHRISERTPTRLSQELKQNPPKRMFTRREFTLPKRKSSMRFSPKGRIHLRAQLAQPSKHTKNTPLPAFSTMSAEGHAHTAENAIFPAFGTFACDVRTGCKRKFTCVPPLRCARCPQRVVHSLDIPDRMTECQNVARIECQNLCQIDRDNFMADRMAELISD